VITRLLVVSDSQLIPCPFYQQYSGGWTRPPVMVSAVHCQFVFKSFKRDHVCLILQCTSH